MLSSEVKVVWVYFKVLPRYSPGNTEVALRTFHFVADFRISLNKRLVAVLCCSDWELRGLVLPAPLINNLRFSYFCVISFRSLGT